MAAGIVSFSINHMCAPRLKYDDFLDLAEKLGVGLLEIRNDLANNLILDGTPPEEVRQKAAERGLRIVSINALQRFNDWNDERAREASELISYAAKAGAQALVLVPTNDGSGRANGERQANLRIALKELTPMLNDAGIIGLVEPLGFETSSLRFKSEAVEAIRALKAQAAFKIVHDTFHHHLAGETEFFPAETGLVHISGVTDDQLATSDMRDGHRVLVDEADRLGNIAQIRTLLAAGIVAPLSFEPFAESVHDHDDPAAAIAASMSYIESRLRQAAA